jgi:hypothetical protein
MYKYHRHILIFIIWPTLTQFHEYTSPISPFLSLGLRNTNTPLEHEHEHCLAFLSFFFFVRFNTTPRSTKLFHFSFVTSNLLSLCSLCFDTKNLKQHTNINNPKLHTHLFQPLFTPNMFLYLLTKHLILVILRLFDLAFLLDFINF